MDEAPVMPVEDNTLTYGVPTTILTPSDIDEYKISVIAREVIGNIQVWLLEASEIQKLRSVGFTDVDTQPSGYDGVMIARMTRPAPKAAPAVAVDPSIPIEFPEWSGEGKAAFRDLARRHIRTYLLPAIKRPVNVYCRRSRLTEPSSMPEFQILVWSSPCAGPETHTNETMWGNGVGARHRGQIAPFAEGHPIFSSEGDEVASVTKDQLFIYHDLFHTGDRTELHIFEKILKEAAKAIAGGLKPPSLDDLRNKYVELCGARLGAQKNQAERDIKELTIKIDLHKRELVDKLRNLTTNQRFLAQISNYNGEMTAKFSAEFDSLMRSPRISHVAFRGTNLMIYTDTIFITDPRSKKIHEIGKFRIAVDTVTAQVLINNMTRVVDGYERQMHAPHVHPNARPCFGNLEATIPQLIAEYEFSALAQMLVAYLEHVNVEDPAGARCNSWPEASAERVAATRSTEEKAREERLASGTLPEIRTTPVEVVRGDGRRNEDGDYEDDGDGDHEDGDGEDDGDNG